MDSYETLCCAEFLGSRPRKHSNRKELQLSSQECSLNEFRSKQHFVDFAFHLLW